MALLVLGYRRLLKGSTAEPEPSQITRWRRISFGLAVFLLWASLDWPLGPLGAGYLASVHMTQFLAVGVAAPALLLLSLPPAAYDGLLGRPRILYVLDGITSPMSAFFLFNIGMTVTHWPGVVDTLMPTQFGSFLLDAAWLAGGLIFWWPVIAPVPHRPGFHPLGKIAYLALNAFLIRPPFAMMIFSERPIYSIYELAPPPGGDAVNDQQFAGAIMKIGTAWIFFVGVVVLFKRWVRAESSAEHSGA
ncbi:MAG: cytochrome c oxidase assembly protein [Chloroflexi bacterium]|nr:cytochrome c oxidase assembly protein [Chloroflexota bacterium]